MPGVLIAENDPMTRALLELYVSQSGVYQVAGSVHCEELTPQRIRECSPQIVLSGLSGVKYAGWLKAQYPDIKLIAMTGEPEYGGIELARTCGADSFWYQQPDAAALIEMMNKTMAGQSVYPQQMAVRIGHALSTDFTEREVQVLREVVAGSTDAEIARTLGISQRTVKGHIQNLRGKTGYRNRTELAVHAQSSGLIVQK